MRLLPLCHVITAALVVSADGEIAFHGGATSNGAPLRHAKPAATTAPALAIKGRTCEKCTTYLILFAFSSSAQWYI